MEILQTILENSQLPLLSAFILGLMTAVSPCPLATNIAAIAYVSKNIENRKTVFINGLIYTLGRAITYAGIGLLFYFGASQFHISGFVQEWGEKLLGPILVIIGVIMLDEHSQTTNSAEIDVNFELKERERIEFMTDVRETLSRIPGIAFTVGQPLGHRIDHMLSGTRANIAIKLFGNDLNKMFVIGNQVKNAIVDINGLVDVNVDQQIEIPQIQIRANREMLAYYGIGIEQFTEFVDIAFGGEKLSDIYEGQRSFDLILRLNKDYTETMEGIRSALIDTHDGKKVPLEQVADIVSVTGPSSISRENVQRKIVISANVAGRDLRGVVQDIQKNIDSNIELPETYRIEYGGQFESEEKASRTLMLTSILAILIIFLLLFQEFKNFKLAGIILLNLPLALIGGVFSIYFTSGILSIPAIIGFITLFGIATRNGILLISNYQKLQNQGSSLHETVIKGSTERLNAILMTALTAALALIPLAVQGDLSGNEIQSPMAKVILGGLLTSTLLNIFIVPIVYSILNNRGIINLNKE